LLVILFFVLLVPLVKVLQEKFSKNLFINHKL